MRHFAPQGIAFSQPTEYTRAMSYADLIREGLKRKGINQVELAKASEVSPATITRLLSGKSGGRGENIARINEVLGIDPDDAQKALTGKPVVPDQPPDRHYFDLHRIPERRRRATIEAIDSLIRAVEQGDEE